MHFFFRRVSTLIADESGQDIIEYALAAAMIGFAAIASMKNLANAVKSVFANIGTTLTSAT